MQLTPTSLLSLKLEEISSSLQAYVSPFASLLLPLAQGHAQSGRAFAAAALRLASHTLLSGQWYGWRVVGGFVLVAASPAFCAACSHADICLVLVCREWGSAVGRGVLQRPEHIPTLGVRRKRQKMCSKP